MRRYPTRTILVATLGLLAAMIAAIWAREGAYESDKLLRLVVMLFVAMGGIGFVTGIVMLFVRFLPEIRPRLAGRKK